MTNRDDFCNKQFSESVSVGRSQIPEYLRCGGFFRSLDFNCDEELITVPGNTLKPDTSISDNNDLMHLLTSLRYWCVDTISPEVVQYCLSETREHGANNVVRHFVQDLPYLAVLSQMLTYVMDQPTLAVKSGILQLVQALHAKCSALPTGCTLAAEYGHLHILKYLHEHGCSLDSSAFVAAIDSGIVECVQYLIEQGLQWPSCALTSTLLSGNTELFNMALSSGCQWDDGAPQTLSASDKHADKLRIAIEHGMPIADDLPACWAAKHGALRCRQVLHEAHCPWTAKACTNAAWKGHLNCLQYLHEHGCPWDSDVFYNATMVEHWSCVEYAMQNDCPLPDADCCTLAVGNGNLAMLQYLHNAGVPWDADTCRVAAEKGDLECLNYAHENGCPWDSNTCTAAAKSGDVECLKYAHENGSPWDSNTCAAAAKSGDVECLRYAHERGCGCSCKVRERESTIKPPNQETSAPIPPLVEV